MAVAPDSPPRRRSAVWLGLGFALLLLALPLRFLPDGQEHSRLGQFLGRFHPALVHLPIALLALVPLMELAGSFKRWSHLRAAAGVVLGLAAAGALVSALDGWLLAWSGGYSGPLVIHHLWGGVALAGLCLVTARLRMRYADGGRAGFVFIYAPLLLVAVGLMVWTSDQGGKISHGENFLTEYMPGRLRAWLHLAPPPPPRPIPSAAGSATAPRTAYAGRIAPIFERSCVSCHNPKKAKAKLMLDSYDHLQRGSEDGPVVVAWYPGQSELVRRITLPRDDDDFMPSNGKNPLSPDEIKLIEQWIAAGASAAQPLDAGK
jgi:uncharacterized membrane protein